MLQNCSACLFKVSMKVRNAICINIVSKLLLMFAVAILLNKIQLNFFSKILF